MVEQVRQLIGQLSNVEIAEPEESDMALSIGGDGTFLRTAARVGELNIPILGINAGHLGFLADVPLDELQDALREVLVEEKYTIQHRRLLHGFCNWIFTIVSRSIRSMPSMRYPS